MAKENWETMTKHLIKLLEMYSILPEHARSLGTQSVSTIYRIYGIDNYQDFIYYLHRIDSIQEILRQNPHFASQLSNVVKEDILSVYQAQNIARIDEFIQQGIKLATPFLCRCLGLIVVFTIQKCGILSTRNW